MNDVQLPEASDRVEDEQMRVTARDSSTQATRADDREPASGMRIVWYWPGPMLQFGGAERVTLEGLRCFRELGATTTLLLNEPMSSETGAFFMAAHSDVEVVPGCVSGDGDPRRWLDQTRRFVRHVRNLHRAIRQLTPDFILVNGERECLVLWIYSLGGLISLPPVVTFIHGSPFQFANDSSKYSLVLRRHLRAIRDSDPVYREVIPIDPPRMSIAARLSFELRNAASWAAVRMCRLVLVLSHKNRKEVQRLYGITSIEVACPGGYGENELPPLMHLPPQTTLAGVRGPVLLSMCRLISKKQVDVIIRAFRVFLDREPQSMAILVIAGTGAEEGALRALARSLNLSDRVRFAGFIPDSEVHDWYAAADVFVNADNADYDLTAMAALPHGTKLVTSVQYEVPHHLASLRRFFFAASPSPESYAETIASALATRVAPLDETDVRELQSMTWESYFREVLDRSRRAIS